MQLRGWELTRASRIVIILLVVQHLGLGQVLAVASATAAGPDPVDPSLTVAPYEPVEFTVVLPLNAVCDEIVPTTPAKVAEPL